MSGEFKEIVRIADTDLKGINVISEELMRIKGIGPTLSRAICFKAGIPINKRVGYLTDEEISRIEEIIRNIDKIFPPYLLNRRFDRVTGKNMHLIGADVKYYMERDIEFEKSINSWRGLRHKLGLKVRGQKTRTTGRKSRPLGVSRKKK